jgi:hypothetical protein
VREALASGQKLHSAEEKRQSLFTFTTIPDYRCPLAAGQGASTLRRIQSAIEVEAKKRLIRFSSKQHSVT